MVRTEYPWKLKDEKIAQEEKLTWISKKKIIWATELVKRRDWKKTILESSKDLFRKSYWKDKLHILRIK